MTLLIRLAHPSIKISRTAASKGRHSSLNSKSVLVKRATC